MSKDWPKKKTTELKAGDTIWCGGMADILSGDGGQRMVRTGAHTLDGVGCFDHMLVTFDHKGDRVRLVLALDATVPCKP